MNTSSTPTAPTGQALPAATEQGSNVNPFELAPPAHVESSEKTPVTEPTVAPSTGEPAPVEPTQVAPPTAPAIPSSADLTKAIVDGLVTAQTKLQQQSQPAPQQPAPMTPEQFRLHYEIPQVDVSTYEALFGAQPDKPERVAALDNLMMGFMRAGVKMGQDLLQAKLGQLQTQYDSQLQPLMTAHQQAQEAAVLNRFTTANPDLANEMALVNDVKDAMIARGVKFGSESEMIKAVGDATRQLLGRLRGTQAGGQQTQTGSSQTGAGGSPRPATRTMTPSLQGGRGGSASSKNQPSIAEQVFGS